MVWNTLWWIVRIINTNSPGSLTLNWLYLYIKFSLLLIFADAWGIMRTTLEFPPPEFNSWSDRALFWNLTRSELNKASKSKPLMTENIWKHGSDFMVETIVNSIKRWHESEWLLAPLAHHFLKFHENQVWNYLNNFNE